MDRLEVAVGLLSLRLVVAHRLVLPRLQVFVVLCRIGLLRLVLLQFGQSRKILLVRVLVRVKRRLPMIKVAAALLLELAVVLLRLIGLVVGIVLVAALGIAHAKSPSLWVLLANIQAVKVLALRRFIRLGLVHLPMLLIVGRWLKWVIIKYELSIERLSFELRMAAVK